MPKNYLKLDLSQDSIGAFFIILFASAFLIFNFAFGFSWPLYIVFSLVAIGVSFFLPLSGLLSLVFLTVIFERFFTLNSIWIGKIEYKIYSIDILLLGIVLGILWKYVKKALGKSKSQKELFKFQKADWILLGFVFLNGCYFVFSLLSPMSERGLAFSALKNYAFYPLLFLVSAFLLKSKAEFKKLYQTFLTACVFLIGFIAFGILHGEGLWVEYTPLSTSGTRILAFTHGLYLSLAFLVLMLYRMFFSQKNNFTLALIWILGITGSLMRHLWLGIIVALGSIWFFSKEKIRKEDIRKEIGKMILASGIILLVFLYATFLFPQTSLGRTVQRSLEVFQERSASLASVQDESYSWRTLVWKGAFFEFKTDPIFGMGTGKKVYVETQFYKDYIELKNVHNSYLSILFQLGILGAGLFIWFLKETIWPIIKQRDKGFWELASLVIAIFYLFILLFQPYLETNLLAVFFWINLGMLRNLKSRS